MTRKKGFILILLYLLLYFINVEFLAKDYSYMGVDIVSFLGSGSASIILYKNYKNETINKKYIFFIFLTSFLCFLGDLTYFYTNGIVGEVSPFHISRFFYILNNITLAIAIYFLIEKSFQKLDGIKIFVDGFVLGLMFFYIAWALIYNNVVTNLLFENFSNGEKLIKLFYLFSNFLMIFGLLLFFTFNKLYLKNKINLLAAFGFVVYFIADLSYVYGNIYKVLNVNILNAMWPLSFLILAISTLEIKEEEVVIKEKLYQDKNRVFNITLLLLSLVLLVLAPTSFIIILPLLIFRVMISKYIKISRYNVILEENAALDPLTKVFNRRKFSDVLKVAIEEKSSGKYGVLLLEINRFKDINSFYGYEIGDKILIDSAKKLKTFLKENDVLGRWNGDEFIMLFRGEENLNEISEKCENILNSFIIPFKYSEKEIICTINIGFCFYLENINTASELVKFADAALHKSKKEGANKIVFYDASSNMMTEYENL